MRLVYDHENERRLADGRVELIDTRRVEASPLYNHDLAPVPLARRNWTTYNYAALWVSMAHCIPTYMLASGLMASGMNWSQALFTILLGNTIVLIPILLNSHPGTKYGIPFPVFARAAYGTLGSNVPALMRALVACGWFGIQAWIGGEALQVVLQDGDPRAGRRCSAPDSPGTRRPSGCRSCCSGGSTSSSSTAAWIWSARSENWAAPFVLVMTGALLWWAVSKANGLGPLLAQPGKFHTFAEFWPVFVPSLTAMIGFWATLSLNMPDFTRFGRSQREQIIGQVVALPTTMSLFAAMGVMITSATAIIYGQAIWDPVQLVGKFSSPVVVAISMFTVVVATIAVNIAANVVSPANDFANAFPRFISFKTGGLITGLLGIAIQPWRLLADPSGLHLHVAARLLGRPRVDRRRAGRRLLDRAPARAAPRGSVSGRTASTAAGTCARSPRPRSAASSPGAASSIPALKPLYDYAWFVGFFAAGLTHLALARRPSAAIMPT